MAVTTALILRQFFRRGRFRRGAGRNESVRIKDSSLQVRKLEALLLL